MANRASFATCYDTYSVTDCHPWQYKQWGEGRWIQGAEERRRKQRKEEFEERQEWIRRRKERLAKEKWIPGLPR